MTNGRPLNQRRALPSMFLLSFALVGCGSSDRVPVSGRVTYDGGDWPVEGSITFSCLEPAAGYSRTAGVARFDRKGNYEVRSQSGKDQGIYPGLYRVHLECWQVPPTMQGPPAKSYLPNDFLREDNDRLLVRIEPAQPVIYNLDVPKPGY
jgi:hypothetical protein